ncbi:hypothetical protein RJ639_038580, partial [Escallonia herrerae]
MQLIILLYGNSQDTQPQTTGRELTFRNDDNITEELLQNHDVLLSTLRSRLTKLQVVRHFWERNDIKGAMNAMRKLPDHSVGVCQRIFQVCSLFCSLKSDLFLLQVHADVVSVLLGKMEIITLDLFSCLLPLLLGLLDSKIDRHANVSLEMLLKLVAVFGTVVNSTISAPAAVGVDLQAEQ